ncbi:MAG: IPExxxVDY family protein [Chitinophagaceae bacterium]|nr:IPExxxVDY family protein [Chitinophagaceae bacterium]MBK8309547.1 IPExxxVDY family protein [Chitinophagaceae bacterium]MBP6478260.1 IPExxxVDY family protein [Chitinophagaceae bacterium]MBP7107809.1 IPExxxVDY family protein [Chitinophagaceae bacterium]MBP7314994.1 IPExxxVDY family protein [Chitinophagaceae bacterium]
MAERNSKLALDNKDLADAFFEDSRLLGIMAPVKDYQFCWHLNNNIGLDFRVNNEIEIKWLKKRRWYYFSVYEYEEPTRFLSHYVYNTQFDGEYLLPEFKHLDFLWLMKGDEVSDESLQETIQTIRSINSVQLVTELAVSQIKNKENLIF